MNTLRKLCTVMGLTVVTIASAQVLEWDKSKYPDYDPIPHVNQAEMRQMQKRVQRAKASGQTRPDHWNNALSDAFPPVMNQSAGSCGSASRIYYMFTHELNAARGVSGKLAENIYPTHFTWLLTWVPNGQGKEVIAKHNGIPNSEVYGGYTYSDDFGYQDCDDGQSNYGWMQGYDKWFHAMHNRISSSANFGLSVESEEGRELVKNYLWNHCGDESYSTGGIVGIGVASGGDWKKIPKTAANDAAGATNQYYVSDWGSGVDHALTIVGYDDRVEFDLDGNGVKGEVDKDEVGAWIIVNSWGSSWCNKGFIYCPYARATPTNSRSGFYQPEYYTARRDYRPLRTLKVTMDYSRRSEIALYVGVAQDLNATQPEKETWLRHFYYSGIGKGVTIDASHPDPEVPMLGKWADGQLHSEPMEFGYDLTDLTDGLDLSKPVKYFFRVETRAWAIGTGNIYKASIVDYTLDREGIETPFELAYAGQPISNKGQKTIITGIARSENVASPRNLNIASQTLSWQKPAGTTYDVSYYRIYLDGELLSTINGSETTTSVTEKGSYTVSAVYSINGAEVESAKSVAAVYGIDAATIANDYLQLNGSSQITIPSYNGTSTNQFTIEFWVYPTKMGTASETYGMKASSGKFFFKVNKSKQLEIGYDGGDYKTSSATLALNKWQHVAIVANDNTLRGYVDGTLKVTCVTGYSNTVGSVGNLVLGQSEGTTANYKQTIKTPWTGRLDELRVWNYARTQKEIKADMNESYLFPSLNSQLTHCYKMETRPNGNNLLLVDAACGNNATISSPEDATVVTEDETTTKKVPFTATSSAAFDIAESAAVGKPVAITNQSAPSTMKWAWTFTGADIETASSPTPIVVFNKTGEQTITLTTTNVNGETAEATKTITINGVEAPQADFTISENEVPVGTHISFINTSTPLDETTYEWTMSGADVETVRTVNAGATYSSNGTYTVRLTATNAAGSSSVEKQVKVVKVAPKSAFTIRNNVAVVGEDIYLVDESKYDPSEWTWTITSSGCTYVVKGQTSSIAIDKPGLYDVTLRSSNEIGSDTNTRSHAVKVCAYDGETGLRFDGEDDEVVTASPFGDKTRTSFTIEFWLYPGTLSDGCLGIGDSQQTFMLTTSAEGGMTAYAKGNSITSYSGYVISNEWHHYAITFSGGSVAFYRDGTIYNSAKKISNVSTCPVLTQFRLGGSDAPMNALIDELRIWGVSQTSAQVKANANAPVNDPATNSKLLLYYDFNQSSGDVKDKSSSNLTGKRNNFGPDGDAWSSSRGIFYLNFDNNVSDVTSKYLKNYKAPFTTASGFVNGTSRFKRLATGTTTSPWIQENSVVDNNISTEFHVDTDKDNNLTLSTSWDGFAAGVQNLKLYQTVELPAGVYELNASRSKWEWTPTGNYLVACAGEGLPDYADLSSNALGYSLCGVPCSFILTEPTKVSLGLLSNQSGKTCHCIQSFTLLTMPVMVIDANGEDAIDELFADEVSAEPTLQATGGLNCITILTKEPQMVSIYTIDGKTVWESFIDGQATVRVPAGIYIVGKHKVLVR